MLSYCMIFFDIDSLIEKHGVTKHKEHDNVLYCSIMDHACLTALIFFGRIGMGRRKARYTNNSN